jgi:hypothetical protein
VFFKVFGSHWWVWTINDHGVCCCGASSRFAFSFPGVLCCT